MQLNRYLFTRVRHTGCFLRRAFSEVSNKSIPETPNTATRRSRDTNNKNNTLKRQLENSTVYLSGLSRFASRKDLTVFLGPHKPITVDPVLSTHHTFTGVYGLKFETLEELSAFQAFVNALPKRVGLQNYSVLQASWFDPRRSVLASTRQVTNRTVRCQLLDKPHTFADRFVQFFENYNLQEEDIERVQYGGAYGPVGPGSGQTSHYLLHFESEEEAVRATVENQHKTLAGSKLKLELFLC